MHYSHYISPEAVKRIIADYIEDIQCVVSVNSYYENALAPGEAQTPGPEIYADGVDTLEFILALGS
jgi:hypothetical protein